MEATIDIEFLQGDNEQVIKEAAVVSDVLQTYLFRPPYHMETHGSKGNGLNWADGFIPYDQVKQVLKGAVAPYDHLYARGYDKCLRLHDILDRPIHDLEDLECPDPMEHKLDVHCLLRCHPFPNMRYAARKASAQRACLVYHLIKRLSSVPVTTEDTQCTSPLVYLSLIHLCPDHSHVTASLVSAVYKQRTWVTC